MNGTLGQLVHRREALVQQSRQQRMTLAAQAGAVSASLQPLERGMRIVRAARAHPYVSAGLLALILLYRPRRTLRWIGRTIAVYSFGRNLFSLLWRAPKHG